MRRPRGGGGGGLPRLEGTPICCFHRQRRASRTRSLLWCQGLPLFLCGSAPRSGFTALLSDSLLSLFLFSGGWREPEYSPAQTCGSLSQTTCMKSCPETISAISADLHIHRVIFDFCTWKYRRAAFLLSSQQNDPFRNAPSGMIVSAWHLNTVVKTRNLNQNGGDPEWPRISSHLPLN